MYVDLPSELPGEYEPRESMQPGDGWLIVGMWVASAVAMVAVVRLLWNALGALRGM